MEETTYVKFKSGSGRKGKAYFEAVNEGLKEFIKNKAWNKNIPEDENRNHDVHVEASYLCHGIWTKIMNNQSNEGKPYSSNYFYWNNNELQNEFLFHFDIMNNPKKQSCGLANCCSPQELDEWTKIYHTIGNMTPIPWFKIDNPTPRNKEPINRYINGQRLHLTLNERWDLFLNLLKNNWSQWCNGNSLTFEAYMLLTCQQIYYSDVYNNFKKEIKDIHKITLKTLKQWDKMITNKSKLISFSEIPNDESIGE
ncbi:MAG: hypothetical protein ACFN08_06440, partial [Granulicatella sp.]